jgi:PAS domain S-box-containing protein
VEGAQGRTYEGTGIGLALVQELVRLHGGGIHVESTLNRGSSFHVRLPLGAAHLPAEQISGPRQLGSTTVRAEAFVAEALRWLPEEHLGGSMAAVDAEGNFRVGPEIGGVPDASAAMETVLFVDDNADMRDYVRRLLAGQYNVSVATNGEQALTMALANPPGIVVADIMMPGMDGFALLQALRANPRTRTVPVILLSARAGEEARSEGMEAGADDYLVKPFNARELLARVSAHLKIATVRKDAEQRLKRVLETDAVAVLFFDRAGTVIDANEVFLRMTGYTRAAIERRELTWRRLTPPEWVEVSEEQMRRLRETGRLGPYEKEYLLADGSRRWMLFAGRDLGDGAISEFCIDITEHKRAEEALRESEERFRALVNATSDAVYRMSPDWTEMRELAGGVFAETRSPTTGWLQTYIPPDAQPEVLETIREAVATRSVFELEHRVWRANGTMGWIHSRAVPLFNPDGQIVEWFGTASDVTARREAEEALRNSLAEREALLNELHHRVKNNLQVVTSLLEMQADQEDDGRAFELFNEARNRVASIASIHELLYRTGAFSKVELTAYARQLVRRLISFYRVDRRIQVAIEGDSVNLELERAVPYGLLLNELISNVCKHAFPGESAGHLTIRLAQADGTIRVQVIDTGIGLPSAFDYRNSETLGLQLVHTLADQLGGSVQFSSQAKGTSVEINLPREREPRVV